MVAPKKQKHKKTKLQKTALNLRPSHYRHRYLQGSRNDAAIWLRLAHDLSASANVSGGGKMPPHHLFCYLSIVVLIQHFRLSSLHLVVVVFLTCAENLRSARYLLQPSSSSSPVGNAFAALGRCALYIR